MGFWIEGDELRWRALGVKSMPLSAIRSMTFAGVRSGSSKPTKAMCEIFNRLVAFQRCSRAAAQPRSCRRCS